MTSCDVNIAAIIIVVLVSISKELNIDPEEVEGLLVSCILDNAIQGRIDQVNQILELDKEPQGSAR